MSPLIFLCFGFVIVMPVEDQNHPIVVEIGNLTFQEDGLYELPLVRLGDPSHHCYYGSVLERRNDAYVLIDAEGNEMKRVYDPADSRHDLVFEHERTVLMPLDPFGFDYWAPVLYAREFRDVRTFQEDATVVIR